MDLPDPTIAAYDRSIPSSEDVAARPVGWLVTWLGAAHPDDARELALRCASGDRYETFRAWYALTADRWQRLGHDYLDAMAWISAGVDTPDEATTWEMDFGLDPFSFRARREEPGANAGG